MTQMQMAREVRVSIAEERSQEGGGKHRAGENAESGTWRGSPEQEQDD